MQIKLIITEPLNAIINQMLNTGIFPDLLKIAKISSIYKKKMMKQNSQIIDQYLYYLQY